MKTKSNSSAAAVREHLLKHYLPRTFLSIAEAGKIIGVEPKTAYALRYRGKFPLPVRHINGRLRVHLAHVIEYVEAAAEQGPLAAKRGRPRKENKLQK